MTIDLAAIVGWAILVYLLVAAVVFLYLLGRYGFRQTITGHDWPAAGVLMHHAVIALVWLLIVLGVIFRTYPAGRVIPPYYPPRQASPAAPPSPH